MTPIAMDIFTATFKTSIKGLSKVGMAKATTLLKKMGLPVAVVGTSILIDRALSPREKQRVERVSELLGGRVQNEYEQHQTHGADRLNRLGVDIQHSRERASQERDPHLRHYHEDETDQMFARRGELIDRARYNGGRVAASMSKSVAMASDKQDDLTFHTNLKHEPNHNRDRANYHADRMRYHAEQAAAARKGGRFFGPNEKKAKFHDDMVQKHAYLKRRYENTENSPEYQREEAEHHRQQQRDQLAKIKDIGDRAVSHAAHANYHESLMKNKKVPSAHFSFSPNSRYAKYIARQQVAMGIEGLTKAVVSAPLTAARKVGNLASRATIGTARAVGSVAAAPFHAADAATRGVYKGIFKGVGGEDAVKSVKSTVKKGLRKLRPKKPKIPKPVSAIPPAPAASMGLLDSALHLTGGRHTDSYGRSLSGGMRVRDTPENYKITEKHGGHIIGHIGERSVHPKEAHRRRQKYRRDHEGQFASFADDDVMVDPRLDEPAEVHYMGRDKRPWSHKFSTKALAIAFHAAVFRENADTFSQFQPEWDNVQLIVNPNGTVRSSEPVSVAIRSALTSLAKKTTEPELSLVKFSNDRAMAQCVDTLTGFGLSCESDYESVRITSRLNKRESKLVRDVAMAIGARVRVKMPPGSSRRDRYLASLT